MIVHMEKQKMPIEKKLKLVYCGELALFAVVFMVLGILFVAGVITPADWKRYAFTYVTLAGCTWIVVDFIWALASKKRRAKSCILDKALVLPVAPVIISFDIYCIINGCAETLPYRYFIGINLIYLSCVYLFEAIYHYYKPTVQMLNIIEETKKAELEEQEEARKEAEENAKNNAETLSNDEGEEKTED